MHKIEAIRLINEELAKGEDVPEAIILAATSFINEASNRIGNVTANMHKKPEVCISRIKTPVFLRQW